jgi:Plant Basic Secretory Protein.
MKKILFLALLLPFISCQNQQTVTNPPELADDDLTTYYSGTPGANKIIFDSGYTAPIVSYQIFSTGELPKYDPSNWILKGTNDNKNWEIIDERKDQKFCSRFQEILCVVKSPGSYKKYMLEISTAKNDTLKIGEVVLSDKNRIAGWQNFKYPHIDFEVKSPDTEGSRLYSTLVQNPDEYIKYHARKVAEILYYTDQDSIMNVQNIKYTLEDKPGVSAKGGSTPNIFIFYSTQHIEKSAHESLYKLNFETRGVLYHELTHGYQYEPKGCGNYGNNKTFWACIEGIADAVRAEAGLFDMSTRKPGGNWMDGYRTTGFFLQWLTTKDPNAIRKFHRTVKDLEVWSFDAGIKKVFGNNTGVEQMWNEYQQYLITTNTNK